MEITYQSAHKKLIEAKNTEKAIEKYTEMSDKRYDGVVVIDSATLNKDSTYPTPVHLVLGIVQ